MIKEIDSAIERLKTETDIPAFDRQLDKIEAKVRREGLFDEYEPKLWELAEILDVLLDKCEAEGKGIQSKIAGIPIEPAGVANGLNQDKTNYQEFDLHPNRTFQGTN